MNLWILLALFVIVALYLYIQNNVMASSTYKIYIPNLHPVVKDKKIVFLSDTHLRDNVSHSFIGRLLNKIEKEKPDLVLFGGDIVHTGSSDAVIEHTKDLFSQMKNIAPTYAVFGNHDFGSARAREIAVVLKRAGVVLLQDEAIWISFDQPDAGFWLMGLNEWESTLENKQDPLENIKFPSDSKKAPKILLTHYPHFFEKYLQNNEKRPDLILAGHAHGGQVILPIIGGLFSPGQGFNPTYDFGLFTNKKYPHSRLVVARGIGNSRFPFRVNNRPEIVVIEFE